MRRGNIVLPDTNVVLRYLLRDIPDQFETAAEFFEKVRSGAERAVILESVLVECVYILLKFYKAPRVEVAASLSGLLQYRGVVNRDKDAMVEALRIFAEGSLDVVDCVLIAKGNQDKIALLTFDKALVRTQRANKGDATNGES